MLKAVVKLVNSVFIPRIDENYVTAILDPVIGLHGISVGENSLSFRDYDPIEEYRYPIKGSESTDNHIKYKDIALICERDIFLEIKLWNGFVYSLSKDSSQKQVYNSRRDLSRMTYFAIKRPVRPDELLKGDW